jgi:hypothetical protein
MPIMINLADDKVVNVKLVLAEIVKKHISEKGKLSEDEAFLQLRQKLIASDNEEIKNVFE